MDKATVKLAAVQAAPIFGNKNATTQKVCDLIREAGSNGANVIGFPEGFIPGHPGWVGVIPIRDEPATTLFCKQFREAVEVPGPETDAISKACKEANIYAVVGINERRKGTTGTLYNTQLFFGRDGTLLHKHQKYNPTVGEKLIHAPGLTGSKSSVVTSLGGVEGQGGGALSGLICGENGNPLAQYSVSLDYPIVHVASWPAHFGPGPDFLSLVHVQAAGLATSLGCFVINSVAVLHGDVFETYGINPEAEKGVEVDLKARAFLKEALAPGKQQASIVGPGGRVFAKGLDDGRKEGIVYATVNLEDLVRIKYAMDYAGHYNRPEIFAHHFKEFL